MNKKLLGVLVVVVLIIGVGLFYGLTNKNIGDTPKEGISDVKEPIEDIKTEEPIIEAPVVADTVTDIAIGSPAPAFTLKNLSGEDVSLSDYKGKIVLLNFWATWCGYCDMEMPDLQKLDEENDDLVVLAIDVMEDRADVQDYITKGGYNFEVVLDEDGSLAQTYLVSGFPTSYFIDEEGILLGGVPGMMTFEKMNEILDSVR